MSNKGHLPQMQEPCPIGCFLMQGHFRNLAQMQGPCFVNCFQCMSSDAMSTAGTSPTASRSCSSWRSSRPRSFSQQLPAGPTPAPPPPPTAIPSPSPSPTATPTCSMASPSPTCGNARTTMLCPAAALEPPRPMGFTPPGDRMRYHGGRLRK